MYAIRSYYAIKTLAEIIGFDSNDHQLIKNALETLAKTIIKWNILDKDGVEECVITSYSIHYTKLYELMLA